MIRIVTPFKGRRLIARRVDEIDIASEAAQEARETGEWVVRCENGGSVANGYSYPAETECVLAVADPLGIVAVWTGRAPANKVTKRGTADACVPGAGDLFDNRVKSVERKQEMLAVLKSLHRSAFSAMEIIAAAASE